MTVSAARAFFHGSPHSTCLGYVLWTGIWKGESPKHEVLCFAHFMIQLSAIQKVFIALSTFLLATTDLGLSADIVKMIESQPELGPHIRRVRGGYLKIQGTWLPYEVCRLLSCALISPYD